jgi:hypothetical protein
MIKRLLPVLILILITSDLISQIPNGSFESWTNAMPDNWNANNFFPNLVPVTATTDAYDGTYALKGEVVSYNGGAVPPNVTPISSSGLGFPINKRYVDLTGWYISDLIGTDVGTVSIVIYHSSGLSIGYGFAYLPAASNYTRFTIPISYTANYPAATAHITFSMADSVGSGFHVGSNIIIDALEFEQVTNILTVEPAALLIFPNPAESQINFNAIFKSGQSYEVHLYNSTGELVKSSLIESQLNSMPSMDINDIPEGIYELLVSDADSKNQMMQKFIICRK